VPLCGNCRSDTDTTESVGGVAANRGGGGAGGGGCASSTVAIE